MVDLTRQLTDLQARYESTRNQHQTRIRELDDRESQLQAQESRVKSEAESIRELSKSLEIRERNARQIEWKQLEREEHLALLEKSIGEREVSLDALHGSLEEQRKQSKALQNLLEEQLGSVSGGLRTQLRQFEQQAKQIGLELLDNDSDGKGLQLKKVELAGCQMPQFFTADEVVNLLGVISHHKQTLELCKNLDFADKIPDVIRIFIERKQLLEAVRFICTFKLTDQFPPVPLLNEYVEDVKKCWSETFSKENSLVEQKNAVHERLTNLRDVVQCVGDYNLKSEYSLVDIINYILELEKLKENLKSVASLNIMVKTKGLGQLKEKREVVLCLPSSVDKQKYRKLKKRSSSTFAPSFRTYRRCRKICNPSAISAARPHDMDKGLVEMS